jgi:hypothetical protein
VARREKPKGPRSGVVRSYNLPVILDYEAIFPE